MKKMCRANRDGSFETMRKREHVLLLVARQLSGELGYMHMKVTSLKPKHVDALVKLWQSQGLAVSTIKSRMSFVRWWSHKVRKPNVVARSNDHYGIGRRVYVSKVSKAIEVADTTINAIEDPYVRASVRLAKAFGLRKEEAIKIMPEIADRGDRLYLRASWCKGGREREVPMHTEEQRNALEEARLVAGSAALIPGGRSYYQQRKRYENITLVKGLRRLHGLRHRYAQLRYKEITGWECPHRGGPKRQALNPDKKKIDYQARLQISAELGHGRAEIVAHYTG